MELHDSSQISTEASARCFLTATSHVAAHSEVKLLPNYMEIDIIVYPSRSRQYIIRMITQLENRLFVPHGNTLPSFGIKSQSQYTEKVAS